MAKITYPTKNTGDQFKATEANEIKASVNALYDNQETNFINNQNDAEQEADFNINGTGQAKKYTADKTLSTINTHAFEDYNTINSTDSFLGYSSYDAQTIFNNNLTQDHLAAYQARSIYTGSGDLFSALRGFWTRFVHNGTGTIQNVRNVELNDIQGTGPVVNNYGVYIHPITRGTTSNYAIYTSGGLHYFAGDTSIGSTTAIGFKLDVNGVSRITGANAAPLTSGSSISNVGLSIQATGVGTTGLGIGVDATNNYSWIQSRNPNDFSVNREVKINPNGGNVSFGTGQIAHAQNQNVSTAPFLITQSSTVVNSKTRFQLENTAPLTNNRKVEFVIDNAVEGGGGLSVFSQIHKNYNGAGGDHHFIKYALDGVNSDLVLSGINNLYFFTGTPGGFGIGTQRAQITNNGYFLINTSSNDGVNRLQVSGSVKSDQYRLSALNTAPASATATGTLGEIRYTATHIYVCTATNTWVRAALATW